MANLRWIRDCWSFFVTNLSPVVTTKDLYGHFREAGTVVFDVFVPKNNSSGASRGFGFIRFKTEWDARKVIKLSNGRSIGGKQISVQMAKYDNHNQ